MCGIVGIVAKDKNIVPIVLEGLKNLEYRGYDSAGISAILENKITTIKASGKISALEGLLKQNKLEAYTAIAHTRWATHGAPTKENAHPHATSKVSVVHNGIIENYLEIKEELISRGTNFYSETDSEVIPNLITHYMNEGISELKSVTMAVSKLKGAFSIAVIFAENPGQIIAARKGSPLVLCYGEGFNAVASDAYALSFVTNKFTYLEENDIALVTNEKVEIFNNDSLIRRNIVSIENKNVAVGKGSFEHFMLKEIYEQPSIISDTIKANTLEKLSGIKIDFNTLSKISLIACGTSYYSAMLAKYWLEKMIDIPIEIDIASEFRYRNAKLPKNGLCIFLSQSGETADTLAALRYAKLKEQLTLSIVNVKQSSLDRESDFSLYCCAGPEISVASTKGFTSQLTVLLLLSLYITHKITKTANQALLEKFKIVESIPGRLSEVLNCDSQIKLIAEDISKHRNVLFVGRNYIFPIALEGALKLKELSYIHAEAIAAGELKHGPIALIDESTPVIALAPYNSLFEKTFSNIQEIAARKGTVISFSSHEGSKHLKEITKHQLSISQADELIEPIIYAVPMQLLAYYVATILGKDVDQPRNLAKSVTVE